MEKVYRRAIGESMPVINPGPLSLPGTNRV